MKGSIAIRIYLSDWRKVRKIFKAEPNETAISYFHRLSKWMQDWKDEEMEVKADLYGKYEYNGEER